MWRAEKEMEKAAEKKELTRRERDDKVGKLSQESREKSSKKKGQKRIKKVLTQGNGMC